MANEPKKRFQIERLEERIAPSAFYWNDGHDDGHDDDRDKGSDKGTC
jgi:hypothetical protein